MSPSPSPALIKLLQVLAAQRRQRTLHQQQLHQSVPQDLPPPYTPSTTPTYHTAIPASPNGGRNFHFDPTTTTITLNTGPRIQGSNNRVTLHCPAAPTSPTPITSSAPTPTGTTPTTPSWPSTPLPPTTSGQEARLLAFLLATIHRLNGTSQSPNPQGPTHLVAGESKSPPAPTTPLRVNVVINSGLTIMGNGNVVTYAPTGQERQERQERQARTSEGGKRKRGRSEDGEKEGERGEKRVKREEVE
ncbi:hypothetical protein KVT40_005986 [Elsinoe batatas]|uniref:Uncharacterized protein n=1 Tax=Elsinoe batatas TaxID=2601811 RepID=A0A8K0L175_9PEZI|nr:hypothetical protein KVT40_005986 [Elsinoe batatas]